MTSEKTWVLLVSINPGGPNGGSATQYFTGSFDGHQFLPEDPSPGPRWLDYGKDNYAGVTWSNIPKQDGRRIFIGWMSNWQYANQVPTQRWRSAMSVPRELKLFLQKGKSHVSSTPVEELASLRTERIDLIPGKWSGQRQVEIPDSLPPSQYEIDLALRFPVDSTMDNGPAASFGLVLSNTLGQQLVLVDRSSVELFVNSGKVVLTEIFFPDEDYHQISLIAGGGAMELLNGSIYSLRGTWQDCL